MYRLIRIKTDILDTYFKIIFRPIHLNFNKNVQNEKKISDSFSFKYIDRDRFIESCTQN